MKKKNLIIVVMTIVMSLLLVACQANPTDLPTENPTGTEAPSPTDKVDPTETPSPTDKVDPTEVPDTGDEVVPSPTEPVEPSPTPEPTEPVEPDPTDEPTETPSVSDEPTETPTPTPEPEPEPTPTPEPHVHKYSETVVKATCTKDGYTTFTCECGDTYQTTLTSPGHKYGEYKYNYDASYTTDGTKTATCTRCGNKNTVKAEGTKLSYTYTELSTIKYAEVGVYVESLPSASGEIIGVLEQGEAVTVTGVCNETGYDRIEYNGGVGYVYPGYLVDEKPAVPEPEPEPEPYDGYDEFGNGYRLNDVGYKFFDVNCPYNYRTVYEESPTVLYVYSLSGKPGMLLTAKEMLFQKYGEENIVVEEVYLGHYEDGTVWKDYIRYVGP